MFSPKWTPNLARESRYTAAGPLASVVFGVALLEVTSLIGSQHLFVFVSGIDPTEGQALPSLRVMALISLAIGLLALVPRAGESLSDGYKLMVLLRGDRLGKALSALEWLRAASLAGLRSVEWDADAVAAVAELDQPEAGHYLYTWHRDRGWPDIAREHLTKLLDARPALSEFWRTYYVLEAAFFEARFANDVAAAIGYSMQVKEASAPADLFARAQAAIALADGDLSAARALAERALNVVGDAQTQIADEVRSSMQAILVDVGASPAPS